jgi:hypothetical protein
VPSKKPLPIDAPDDHIRPDLEKLVAELKQRLRLQDWDVSAEYARHYDMDGAFGSCVVNIERNLAIIKIMEPSDINPASRGNNSVLATLIHELRHIPFRLFRPKDDTLKYQLWERTIDMDSVIFTEMIQTIAALRKELDAK